MNYLDLFSGCGGFRLGLQKAGVTPTHEFHSEIDKHADKVYCEHYPQSENLGDVTTIEPTDGTIRGHKINLITYGFPCQDLSVAGKGRGLEGSRSGLFYQATRLIRELKPEVFIFENVKGLFTSRKGADFTEVLREIADIGLYDCEWQLLNTRWVLPQNRERIFFVGYLRGSRQNRRKIFPIAEPIQQDRQAHKGTREKMGHSQCLTTRGPQSRQNADYTWIKTRPRGFNKGGVFKEYSPTLTSNSMQNNCYLNDLRALTPIEWERLQGFNDNWTASVSDTQRYKMLGNAVTADIAKMVFKRVFNVKND